MADFLSYRDLEKTLLEYKPGFAPADQGAYGDLGGGRGVGSQRYKRYDMQGTGLYDRLKQGIHRKMSHAIDKKDAPKHFQMILDQFNKYYEVFAGADPKQQQQKKQEEPKVQQQQQQQPKADSVGDEYDEFPLHNAIKNIKAKNAQARDKKSSLIGQQDETTYNYLRQLHDYFVSEWQQYHRDYGVDPATDNPNLLTLWRELSSKMDRANKIAQHRGFKYSSMYGGGGRGSSYETYTENEWEQFFNDIRRGKIGPQEIAYFLQTYGIDPTATPAFMNHIKRDDSIDEFNDIEGYLKKLKGNKGDQKNQQQKEKEAQDFANTISDMFTKLQKAERNADWEKYDQFADHWMDTYNKYVNKHGTPPKKIGDIDIEKMYEVVSANFPEQQKGHSTKPKMDSAAFLEYLVRIGDSEGIKQIVSQVVSSKDFYVKNNKLYYPGNKDGIPLGDNLDEEMWRSGLGGVSYDKEKEMARRAALRKRIDDVVTGLVDSKKILSKEKKERNAVPQKATPPKNKNSDPEIDALRKTVSGSFETMRKQIKSMGHEARDTFAKYFEVDEDFYKTLASYLTIKENGIFFKSPNQEFKIPIKQK